MAMLIHRKLVRLFIFILGLLATLNTSAQDTQEVSTGVHHKQCIFNRVEIGKAFYLHRITMAIISSSEHEKICTKKHNDEIDLTKIEKLIPPFAAREQSRVNPYQKLALPNPFKLKFEVSTFTPPIDRKMVVTSRYGMRYSGPHRGIDIDLLTGDTVRTILPGRVRFVGYSKGHGKTVVVRHANDVETVYAHLSKFLVEENDLVSGGLALALGGNSGNSRGSHLHLEIRYHGTCIHPEYILNFDGSNTIIDKDIWVNRLATSPKLHSSYRKSKIVRYRNMEEALSHENSLPKFHIVQKGDTLSHIARAYSLDISEICTLNSISKKSVLSIGQVIEYR